MFSTGSLAVNELKTSDMHDLYIQVYNNTI